MQYLESRADALLDGLGDRLLDETLSERGDNLVKEVVCLGI
jgi:hypothetical protein